MPEHRTYSVTPSVPCSHKLLSLRVCAPVEVDNAVSLLVALEEVGVEPGDESVRGRLADTERLRLLVA